MVYISSFCSCFWAMKIMFRITPFEPLGHPHLSVLCLNTNTIGTNTCLTNSFKVRLLFQWCKSGRCVSKKMSQTSVLNSIKSAPVKVEKINGGWSKWKQSGDCASGCLFGEEGRLSSGSTGIMTSTRVCNNPR